MSAKLNKPWVDVTSVRPISGATVFLTFSDGAERLLNLRQFMRGPIFDEIFEKGAFNQVMVDPLLGTIAWPNGADLSPYALRYAARPIAGDAGEVRRFLRNRVWKQSKDSYPVNAQLSAVVIRGERQVVAGLRNGSRTISRTIDKKVNELGTR